MFVNASHFHLSLLIDGKEWSLIKGSTRLGSSLACKYYTRALVTDSDKHSSSEQYRINYDRKKNYSSGLQGVDVIKLLSTSLALSSFAIS